MALSGEPSLMPLLQPTLDPSSMPSSTPRDEPSSMPSLQPSSKPSSEPSSRPCSDKPSLIRGAFEQAVLRTWNMWWALSCSESWECMIARCCRSESRVTKVDWCSRRCTLLPHGSCHWLDGFECHNSILVANLIQEIGSETDFGPASWCGGDSIFELIIHTLLIGSRQGGSEVGINREDDNNYY